MKDNENKDKSIARSNTTDSLYKDSKGLTPTDNHEPFDFEIDQEFIDENKKINLVRPRQKLRQKFAPFTKSQRRKRRMEVYRLHFEKGIPAIRIAHLMKVDRNTINNDLRILYSKALNEYNPDMSLDDILQKQLVRFETQRDRLGLYLSNANDINSKIAIERLIADIDFKLIGAIEKLNHNVARFWEEIIKEINNIAENNKWNTRYTSAFELRRISIESGKSLNKLREEILKEK
jgi:hypothetical protein